MLVVIIALLLLTALYCGGNWLIHFARYATGHYVDLMPAERETLERYTFHLGISFILAIGFAGLILVWS